MAVTLSIKAVITCLEPGQFIPVHGPSVDMLLLVPEGEGRVIAGEQEEAAGPEILHFAPAGEAHALEAHTRIVGVHVVNPPPTDAPEVAARLKEEDQR